MIRCVTVATPELGDRSYLLHDGQVAVAVDPQRATSVASSRLRLTPECGSPVSPRPTSTTTISQAAELWPTCSTSPTWSPPTRTCPSPASASPMETRWSSAVGSGSRSSPRPVTRFITSPTSPSTTARHPWSAVGSLLFGTTGRTDLGGEALAAPLARAQFRSARRLGELADDVCAPAHPRLREFLRPPRRR